MAENYVQKSEPLRSVEDIAPQVEKLIFGDGGRPEYVQALQGLTPEEIKLALDWEDKQYRDFITKEGPHAVAAIKAGVTDGYFRLITDEEGRYHPFFMMETEKVSFRDMVSIIFAPGILGMSWGDVRLLGEEAVERMVRFIQGLTSL